MDSNSAPTNRLSWLPKLLVSSFLLILFFGLLVSYGKLFGNINLNVSQDVQILTVNGTGQVDFDPSADIRTLKNEARKMAVEDAKQVALSTAQQTNVKLGRLNNINEFSDNSADFSEDTTNSASSSATTKEKVTVSVTLSYEFNQ